MAPVKNCTDGEIHGTHEHAFYRSACLKGFMLVVKACAGVSQNKKLAQHDPSEVVVLECFHFRFLVCHSSGWILGVVFLDLIIHKNYHG